MFYTLDKDVFNHRAIDQILSLGLVFSCIFMYLIFCCKGNFYAKNEKQNYHELNNFYAPANCLELTQIF